MNFMWGYLLKQWIAFFSGQKFNTFPDKWSPPTLTYLKLKKKRYQITSQLLLRRMIEMGFLWVRNLMISPSSFAVFHQTPHRTSFLCSYRFLACCSSQRLRLRSQTIPFPVLLHDFRLEENMAVDFSYITILTRRRKNHAVLCLVSRSKYEVKMLVTDWILSCGSRLTQCLFQKVLRRLG